VSHIPTIVTVTDRDTGAPFSFGVEHLHSYFPEPLDPETARVRVPGTNIVILRPPLVASDDRGGALVFGIKESFGDFQALLGRAGVQQFGLGPTPSAYAMAAVTTGSATATGWDL